MDRIKFLIYRSFCLIKEDDAETQLATVRKVVYKITWVVPRILRQEKSPVDQSRADQAFKTEPRRQAGC